MLRFFRQCRRELLGCISKRHVDAKSDEMIFAAVKNSPTFQDVQKRVKRPAYMIDHEDAQYIYLEIGENLPERFLRITSLKISKNDGGTWRQVVESSGEEVWELESSGKVPPKPILK
jgi:hypothetical protein